MGGYYGQRIGLSSYRRAMQLLASEQVNAERMTTHRFDYTESAAAFALLWNHPRDALGVLLEWDR